MVSYYKPYEIEDEKENETGAKTKELIKKVGKTIKNFASEYKREFIISGSIVGAMYISYKIGSLVTANSIKNQVFEMAMNGEITFNKN